MPRRREAATRARAAPHRPPVARNARPIARRGGLLAFALVVTSGVARADGAPSTTPARADDGERVLVARPRGDAPIVLDGKLDEAVWASAPAGTRFVERGPVPGAQPPVETRVSVLYDREALYVGVRCELLPGERPKADNLVRDSTRVWSDESLTLKFDVRHDRRTTVVFALNPAGVQLDALVVDNGRLFRAEYDAIWELGTHVDEGFWSAEVRIPVAALGMPAVEGERVMGFNVARDHNSRIADYDWSHLPPEFGPWSATHYGELRGIRDIAAGRPFTLQPYIRYGNPEDPEADLVGDDELGGVKAGGDLRLRVGSDTWGEVTVLTDFAQVDVDDQVLNLDRFPLVFPEQRPFFLSGLGVFEFGEPGEAQLLFTRRIGLDADRRAVPILAGAKVYGSHGAFDYGVLDVVTDDTLRPAPDPAGNPLGSAAANWSVARLKTNFDNPGHVGFLIAARNDMDLPLHEELVDVHDEPHLALGMDGLVRAVDDRLELSAFAAYARNEPGADAAGDAGLEGIDGAQVSRAPEVVEGAAMQMKARWLGESLQPELTLRRVSADFEPQAGFVRRPGTLDSKAVVPFVYRTTALGLSSVILRGTEHFTHDDEAETLLRRESAATLEVDWKSGWGSAVTMHHGVDRVRGDFELLDGLRVEPGRYSGPQVRVVLDTPSVRNPNANLAYTGNDAFFSGVSHTFEASGGVSFGRHVRLAVGATLTQLELAGCVRTTDANGKSELRCGNPDRPRVARGALESASRRTLALNSSLGVQPSPDLSLDLNVQLNTQSEEAVGQLRIRYRYLPGSDMFFVYQENLSYAEEAMSERSLVLKVAYRYDTML